MKTSFKLARLILFVVGCLSLTTNNAEAKTTVKPKTQTFYYHFQDYGEVFDPSKSNEFRIYNCPDGIMPQRAYLADADQWVFHCGWSVQTGFKPAQLIHSVTIPPGTCVDRGKSCSYRNSQAKKRKEGLGYFRILYKTYGPENTYGHGNKVYLESYGDLSKATVANMMVVRFIDGNLYTVLDETFTPIANGGWWFDF